MGINNFRYFHIICLITLLLFPTSSFSQNSAGCDLKFVDHLVNAGSYKEALFLLDKKDCLSNPMNDTINYLRGWSLYSLKRLEASSESLMKISPSSSYYPKSHFYAAYNMAHTGNYVVSMDLLEKIEVYTEKFISLKNYQIAGVNLLQGNISGFKELIAKTDRSFFEISEPSDKLSELSLMMSNHKSKSPVTAGIMSGIIPGSGKFYAGKKGGAISSFLATVGLGVVTWENYRKSGIKSFKTIAFGTAFAVSYAANIYGAVVSVRILETEYKENVKNSILFNLHIPLRNSFDK